MPKHEPPVPKLQRPLHRMRGRPRVSPPIRNTQELKQLFGCSKAELPHELALHGVDYHMDSQGQFWAALEAVPELPAGARRRDGQGPEEGSE